MTLRMHVGLWMFVFGAILCLCLWCAATAQAQVNLIADPSFESGWTYWTTDHPLSWFATDQRKHSGVCGMYANWMDGNHWVTSIDVLPAGTYDLLVYGNTWWPDSYLIAELGDGRTEWHLSPGDSFYPYTATLTTTGGQLRFAAYSPQANHLVIDDVSLHTPEPGAWLVLGAGALWMLGLRLKYGRS